MKDTWTNRDFADTSLRLKQHEYKLFYEKGDPKALQFLENLRSFLTSKRTFLLRLFENPSLREQESLTEKLWAVFHVADELQYRPYFAHLPGGGTDTSLLTQGEPQRAQGRVAEVHGATLKVMSLPVLLSVANKSV